MLANAATLSESTLIDISSHKFAPHGVTAVALLAESHFNSHLAEDGIAVCDVFTCGEKTSPRSLPHTCMKQWEQLILYLKPLLDHKVNSAKIRIFGSTLLLIWVISFCFILM